MRPYQIEHRPVVALNKMFCEGSIDDSKTLFKKIFETPLVISPKENFKKEVGYFRETLMSLMKDLSKAIARENPLFGFKPQLSGSMSEGTKVIEMNEADVLCVFTHPVWEKISITPHEDGNYSYMKIEKDDEPESAEVADRWQKLFKGNILSTHAVFQGLYSLVRKHVAEVLARYKNLYIVDIQSILSNYHAITPLHFVWCGEFCRWQEFDVDVVPAIPLLDEKIPKELNHSQLIHDLVVVPKWTAGLIEKDYQDAAFQLGFSMTEKDFFYTMPVALRQGYMLAKVALHKCLVIDDLPAGGCLSSYMLKCKMFECFCEMPDFRTEVEQAKEHTRDLFADALQPPKDVLHWANMILEKLEHDVANKELESFFLPGCNLLGHGMYKNDYRPLMYVQMCRAFINSPSEDRAPWAKLALSVAQQLLQAKNLSQGEAIQEILLLQNMGLDPKNVRCPEGYSVLYHMITLGLDEVKYALTEWQVSLDNIDGRGSNAIKVAEEKRKKDTVNYLHRNTKGN